MLQRQSMYENAALIMKHKCGSLLINFCSCSASVCNIWMTLEVNHWSWCHFIVGSMRPAPTSTSLIAIGRYRLCTCIYYRCSLIPRQWPFLSCVRLTNRYQSLCICVDVIHHLPYYLCDLVIPMPFNSWAQLTCPFYSRIYASLNLPGPSVGGNTLTSIL